MAKLGLRCAIEFARRQTRNRSSIWHAILPVQLHAKPLGRPCKPPQAAKLR